MRLLAVHLVSSTVVIGLVTFCALSGCKSSAAGSSAVPIPLTFKAATWVWYVRSEVPVKEICSGLLWWEIRITCLVFTSSPSRLVVIIFTTVTSWSRTPSRRSRSVS